MDNSLEALKLLKEWSTWLVTIQTGALGLIAAIANPKSTFTYGGAGAKWTVVCLGLSIVCATWVLAAIPSIAQRLKPTDNIHSMRLFEWLPIPLWVLTALQHWFTVAGILIFIISYATKE
ncbi:MAG: hypothetical protein M3362_06015 [Acidobacteriota bacterium]|nr:hypothetical protein [Acidobacteriota bacterium]